MTSRFTTLLALVALMGTSSFAESPKRLAKGTIHISKELEASAKGVRTLFISVYDSESRRPRPYGALKAILKQDAKGRIYEFDINPQNIVVMNPAANPQVLRIKAKLDKDGGAGPDRPGDLVGIVRGIKRGSEVKITIDRVVK